MIPPQLIANDEVASSCSWDSKVTATSESRLVRRRLPYHRFSTSLNATSRLFANTNLIAFLVAPLHCRIRIDLVEGRRLVYSNWRYPIWKVTKSKFEMLKCRCWIYHFTCQTRAAKWQRTFPSLCSSNIINGIVKLLATMRCN